jgi:YggT family protein
MLYSIFSLLLNLVGGILAGACLLRLYMQWQRSPFGNPLGQFVMAVTNWLVLPLRRVVKSLSLGGSRLDIASLLGAYLIALAQVTLMWLVAPGAVLRGAPVAMLAVFALFGLAQLIISALIGLLIVYAVLSWVQPHSPVYASLDRLCQPLLAPVRRHIPTVGGVDLSLLVVMVLLQVALIALQHLQAGV